MAFNPFHTFRKHQKVIFAVMAIVCMFVFVLQFGRGDLFERAAGWFGGGKQKDPVVATVYGKKVYAKDLDEEKRRAEMVNLLVMNLQRSALQSLSKLKL